MSTFLDLLADARPHLFDGAMGTMIYARGVYINRCYDELNLVDPELIRSIHREYVRNGAELLETNSFGANRVKLAQHGLEGQVRAINAAAARLARQAAEGKALVGGSIGPLGIRIEPYGPTSLEEARAIFREQVEGLLEGGVDFFVMETFSDLQEIHQAMLAVRDACELPMVAQMTIQEDGTTSYGTSPEVCAARLDEWGADVVGLNCSVGPAVILDALERIAPLTGRKLSAQPNAGMPREISGRKMYMASPEYMAAFAQRLTRAGVKLIGGCCGTTPEHIKRMGDAVRSAASGHISLDRGTAVPTPPDVKVVPFAQRSTWAQRIAAGQLVTTVEIVPPRGVSAAKMLADVKLLKRAGVDAVNVPDGPRAQMRMGALPTAVLVEQTAGIETVLHYTCRDRNLLGMLSDLLGAHALGLRNLLLITGDPPKMGPYPEATAVFDIDSIGLTNLVAGLNRGLDPGANPIGQPTSFAIGVGVNPGADDRDYELQRFYWKVEAGAEYAVTQPVFDPDQLLEFMAELEKRSIAIPVVAGIWPLVSVRNAEFMANEVPGVVVPTRVLQRMRNAGEKGKEAALEEGIAIAREMLERVRPYVRGVQVSAPFGRVALALRVFQGLPGIDAGVAEESPAEGEIPGFQPPARSPAAPPIGSRGG